MIKITTNRIQHAWYHAHAIINGKRFNSFMATREAALAAVYGQLAALGYLRNY